MNDPESKNTEHELELTPVCDPPMRASPDTPIGHCWWIEPSHPEIDPPTSLAPAKPESDE